MKTATVTWITFNNYGTALQAYALQRYIISLNIENFIISDKEIVEDLYRLHSTISNDTAKTLPNNKTLKYYNPKHIIHRYKKRLLNFNRKRKQKKRNSAVVQTENLYNAFKSERLIIKTDVKKESLFSLNDTVDAFLCGSDQIWSPLKHNFDPFFYLNFVTKKKVSYAASVGANTIDGDYQSKVSSLLKDFHSISVRESITACQLTHVLNRNVEWVCDPTLLFDAEFWRKTVQQVKVNARKKKYILCYFLENKNWYFEYAKMMAHYLGLSIVVLPNRIDFLNRNETYKRPVGPLEFVKLIQESSYVLTDSYHGVLFAINYNKQFICIKRFSDLDYNCQNIRIYSILQYLGLTSLIIEEKEFESNDIKPIAYQEVNQQIASFRKKSRQFLCRSLLNE